MQYLQHFSLNTENALRALPTFLMAWYIIIIIIHIVVVVVVISMMLYLLNDQILGLVKRFRHYDVFLNSSMENPGLLGNVSKCPISCDGALQEVHLKNKQAENHKKGMYSMYAQCFQEINMGLINSS